MSVLTLDDAKAHLNITGESDNAELQDTIEEAESAIAELVGPLTATSATDRVPGWGYTLWLYTKPASTLTSVTITNTATTVDTSTLYLKTDSAGVERNDGGFFDASSYDVTYMAGRTSVPSDLRRAIKELARHLWQTQRGAADRPMMGMSVDGGLAQTLPGSAYTFPTRVQELLWPHLLSEFKTTGWWLRSSRS